MWKIKLFIGRLLCPQRYFWTKDEIKYKICIEVTPNFTIRQAFGPCNSELDGEAFKAYSEWCQEKHIVRRKAFSIHCAPGR